MLRETSDDNKSWYDDLENDNQNEDTLVTETSFRQTHCKILLNSLVSVSPHVMMTMRSLCRFPSHPHRLLLLVMSGQEPEWSVMLQKI